MADRPILFSAPMIRALLDGRKTQTRRIIKMAGIGSVAAFERVARDPHGRPVYEMRDGAGKHYARPAAPGFIDYHYSTPIGFGDRLWVRETWWHPEPYSYGTLPSGDEFNCPRMVNKRAPVHYAADGNPPNCSNRHYGKDGLRGGSFAAPDPWAVWTKRPSIHMPRWASRLTLAVIDVRVECLQDISEADAIAEGCFKGKASGRVFANATSMHLGGDEWANARDWYADLWDSINGPGAWDANPWVAAYTFTVHSGNIDRMEAKHG